MTQTHMEPPPITLIKENYDGKSDKDFVKLKLRRDPTSSTSDLYEFKMPLFDNGDPEEFLLFVCNNNTTLASSATFDADANVQYLRTIVCGEELHQFESLSADVEST